MDNDPPVPAEGTQPANAAHSSDHGKRKTARET
jgi:hypothetical protein